MISKLIRKPIPDYNSDGPDVEKPVIKVKRKLKKQLLVLGEKKVEAELNGYKQIFPEELDYLNTLNNEHKLSYYSLFSMSKATHERETVQATKTGDGYRWYRSYRISAGKGELAILLPWTQDWDKKEGTQMDRSIGVYATENADQADVKRVLKEILRKNS